MLMLPEVLTLREARASLRMLSQALQREGTAGPVAIDASGLRRFDSSALAVLLECQRLALSFGRAFEVRQAPALLADLARLYGVEPLLLPRAA
jgi:phospholipid transport system transporter-binding protein